MKELTTILPPRQRELEARLDPAWQPETEAPVVGAGTLVYEMGEKVRAIAAGGIGLVEQLVEAIGLRARLDERVSVLTRISDVAVVPYRQDPAPRLDFWGSDIRNHATEGDTLWVNDTTSHFSSRSTVS